MAAISQKAKCEVDLNERPTKQLRNPLGCRPRNRGDTRWWL